MSGSLCDPVGAPCPATFGFGARLLRFPPTAPSFPQSPTKSCEDARGGCSAALPRTRDDEQCDGVEGSWKRQEAPKVDEKC